MIALLRTLTRKSKLGFGKNKNYTVEDLLSRNKQIDLISAYYKLTSINFTDDILLQLKINEDEKIIKPGIDLDMYYSILEKYPAKIRNRASDKLKPKNKPYTKEKLQSINHGHTR